MGSNFAGGGCGSWLDQLLGPASRFGMERKALHVFNHFASEAKS